MPHTNLMGLLTRRGKDRTGDFSPSLLGPAFPIASWFVSKTRIHIHTGKNDSTLPHAKAADRGGLLAFGACSCFPEFCMN